MMDIEVKFKEWNGMRERNEHIDHFYQSKYAKKYKNKYKLNNAQDG